MLLIHAFVIVGAWLMFMLQPLIGRLLLPGLGGGFHVWATCMMFFQGMLLLGYAYAHWALPRLGRGHLLLVLVSLGSLPIGVSAVSAERAGPALLPAILLLQVGLPFGVLATTSVAAQLWVARRDGPGAADPYPLYASSNLGSLLGLLSYPLLIEPALGLQRQRQLWSALYVMYALLALLVWVRLPGRQARRAVEWPAGRMLLYWFSLSGTATMLLLGTTHLIALGAGSVPLVWVLALATYLASFIAAFQRTPRALALRRLIPEACVLGLFLFTQPGELPELIHVALLLGALYLLCWGAHLEQYMTRPPPAQLSAFYLTIASGGLFGGVVVTFAAPSSFHGLQEYPLGVLLLALTLAIGGRRALATWLRARTHWAAAGRFHYLRWLRALALAGASTWLMSLAFADTGEYRVRSAYGLFSVWETERGAGSERRSVVVLNHNHTSHGLQSRRADERRTPTGYYGRESPVGELFSDLTRPARLGIVGLGTGTVAAYFDRGDDLVFYEIDPVSEQLARQRFSYLADCRARVRVVIGDARLSLQREHSAPRHSALLIDAFSGDAIPFHLLTREALALYLSRVDAGAPVIFHISNRFYELWPSLAATARSLGAAAAHKTRSDDLGDRIGPLEWSSHYLVISRDAGFVERLGRRGWTIIDRPDAAAWTDDRVNLLAALWFQLRSE